MEETKINPNLIKPNSKEALLQLEKDVQTILNPEGFEVVALEMGHAPKSVGRTLILFIDFIDNPNSEKKISLDDCVKVNDLVDQLFETTPLLDGTYTLEVSSPGVERPLRKQSDYTRFKGKKIRINTQRPLTVEEIKNENYWTKNQKQKSFVGTLDGLTSDGASVQINFDGVVVCVPISLITKAHLEFDPNHFSNLKH